jgi:hypothetical protein
MKKILPNSAKKSVGLEHDLEKFVDLIVEALRFADQSKLDWSTIVSATIYETTEYACFKSNGSLTGATQHIPLLCQQVLNQSLSFLFALFICHARLRMYLSTS